VRRGETARRVSSCAARRVKAPDLVSGLLCCVRAGVLPEESRGSEGAAPAEHGRPTKRQPAQDDRIPSGSSLCRLWGRDIVVLQFDHLGDKERNVSSMLSGSWSGSAIEMEIAKCQVRCANCHRLRTALRYRQRQPPRKRQVVPPEQLRISDGLPRVCRVCQQTKPLSEFPFRSRAEGTRHWICLACQRSAAQSWYLARVPHARRVDGYGTFVRESLSARIDQYLYAHPCVDCGEENIALLDFDHLRDKTADISTMVRDAFSWEQIAQEIAKCAVRCANCHARVTASRIGAYRLATA